MINPFLFLGCGAAIAITIATSNAMHANRLLLLRYREFLKVHEGAVYFAYNNKREILDFIRNEMLPILPGNVAIMFLNGRSLEPGAKPEEFPSAILYDVPTRMGFPYLIRIYNGEVYGISIRTSTFSIFRQGKPVDKLMRRIESFYTCEDPSVFPLAI